MYRKNLMEGFLGILPFFFFLIISITILPAIVSAEDYESDDYESEDYEEDEGDEDELFGGFYSVSEDDLEEFEESITSSSLKFRAMKLSDDLSSILPDQGIFIDFNEFMKSLSIALEYNPESEVIDGFFGDLEFSVKINLQERTIKLRDEVLAIESKDLIIFDDLLYITVGALNKWFKLGAEYFYQFERLALNPEEKLPVEKKLARYAEYRELLLKKSLNKEFDYDAYRTNSGKYRFFSNPRTTVSYGFSTGHSRAEGLRPFQGNYNIGTNIQAVLFYMDANINLSFSEGAISGLGMTLTRNFSNQDLEQLWETHEVIKKIRNDVNTLKSKLKNKLSLKELYEIDFIDNLVNQDVVKKLSDNIVLKNINDPALVKRLLGKLSKKLKDIPVWDSVASNAYLQKLVKSSTVTKIKKYLGDNLFLANMKKGNFVKTSLKPTNFALLETAVASVPLAGGAATGLGFSVNNLPRKAYSNAYLHKLQGYTKPNWQVEYFKNGELLGFSFADEKGYYSYDEDLEITNGDNVFLVKFYGPYGEVEEEEREYVLKSEIIKSGDLFYELQAVIDYTLNDFLFPTTNESISTGGLSGHLGLIYGLTRKSSISFDIGSYYNAETDKHDLYLANELNLLIKKQIIKLSIGHDVSHGGISFKTAISRKILGKDMTFSYSRVWKNFHILFQDDYRYQKNRQLISYIGGSNDEILNVKTLRSSLSTGFGGNLDFKKLPLIKYKVALSRNTYHDLQTAENIFNLSLNSSLKLKFLDISNSLTYNYINFLEDYHAISNQLQFSISKAINDHSIDWKFDMNSVFSYSAQQGSAISNSWKTSLKIAYKIPEYRINPNFLFLYNQDGSYSYGVGFSKKLFAGINASVSFSFDDQGEFFVSVGGSSSNNIMLDTVNRKLVWSKDLGIDKFIVNARVFEDINLNNVFDQGVDKIIDGVHFLKNKKSSVRGVVQDEKSKRYLIPLESYDKMNLSVQANTLEDGYLLVPKAENFLGPAGNVLFHDFPLIPASESEGTVLFAVGGEELVPLNEIKVSLINKNNPELLVQEVTDDEGLYYVDLIGLGSYEIKLDDSVLELAKIKTIDDLSFSVTKKADFTMIDSLILEPESQRLMFLSTYEQFGHDLEDAIASGEISEAELDQENNSDLGDDAIAGSNEDDMLAMISFLEESNTVLSLEAQESNVVEQLKSEIVEEELAKEQEVIRQKEIKKISTIEEKQDIYRMRDGILEVFQEESNNQQEENLTNDSELPVRIEEVNPKKKVPDYYNELILSSRPRFLIDKNMFLNFSSGEPYQPIEVLDKIKPLNVANEENVDITLEEKSISILQNFRETDFSIALRQGDSFMSVKEDISYEYNRLIELVVSNEEDLDGFEKEDRRKINTIVEAFDFAQDHHIYGEDVYEEELLLTRTEDMFGRTIVFLRNSFIDVMRYIYIIYGGEKSDMLKAKRLALLEKGGRGEKNKSFYIPSQDPAYTVSSNDNIDNSLIDNILIDNLAEEDSRVKMIERIEDSFIGKSVNGVLMLSRDTVLFLFEQIEFAVNLVNAGVYLPVDFIQHTLLELFRKFILLCMQLIYQGSESLFNYRENILLFEKVNEYFVDHNILESDQEKAERIQEEEEDKQRAKEKKFVKRLFNDKTALESWIEKIRKVVVYIAESVYILISFVEEEIRTLYIEK